MKSVLLFFLLLCATLSAEDFDVLMGKNTPHWAHLQDHQEIAALQEFKELFNKNIALKLHPGPSSKIPHVLHLIWLGPKSFPAESVENVRTWIAKNPTWKVKFWTDRDRATPCAGMEKIVIKDYPFPFLKGCYEQSENWGEKSDILRYEILYQEGGAYADHDANCLRPFSDLHGAYDFYCCLEAPHPSFAGHNLTAGIGLLGSKAGHPIIKRVIEKIGAHWDEIARKFPGQDGYSRTQTVIERTYLVMTDVLKELAGKTDNADIVFPAAYFFAKGGIKSIYSKHFFADSWSGGSEHRDFEKKAHQELSRIEKKATHLIYVGIVFCFFNVFLILLSILLSKRKRSI